MKLRYCTCDVFTPVRFGGNPLAVLPQAAGLSDPQMQQIAREFNYSESAFVFPAEAGHTRKVRIFTPVREVPFAGHPNVGTAFVLAQIGELGTLRAPTTITFEEQAGLVPITIDASDAGITACELSAPQPLSLGKAVSPALVARALSLSADDIVLATHPPMVASVGLPFLVAELKDRAALQRARPDLGGFEAVGAEGIWPSVHVYARVSHGHDLRARMFAPLTGVPEDPATGSANGALVSLLAQHDARRDGALLWRIAQGVEMGRPSTLQARVQKVDGAVTGTWVGGACVMVADGTIEVA
jgi:trans-2,3-dihydro-3-hydroxyanthranilate isomerase